MTQRGILKSEQGSQGGYAIIRDLSKTSFYELVELTLGPLGIVKCINGIEGCMQKDTCNVKSPMAALNARLVEFYKTLPLSEILKVQDKELDPTS
jgi:DNA-binding IscR family transcriptional regulator